MHSFLLIGQSNMAGRGFLEEACPIETERIYTLINGRWQRMFRPINPDRSFSCVNLAESFAEQCAKEYGTDIGLICCADGGTQIDQWKPGELLYDNAVFHARLAQRTSVLSGVLWHQGESDCATLCRDTYKERLEQMMKQLRADLKQPDLPLLLGGLGDYLPNYPKADWQLNRYTVINDILKDMAEEWENTGYVSAEGLLPNSDQLHFNAKALHEFGLRYFAEYKKIFGTCLPVYGLNKDIDLIRSEMEKL